MFDPQKISIFISYAHKDEKYRESLEEHLSTLRRRGQISHWTDRKITPGEPWANEIDKNIKSADIIILLISSSFIASGYCYEKELGIALQRHEAGSAVVIPIFVRPTDLNGEPIMMLQGLPKDALSISEWSNEDLAWRNVSQGIRTVVEDLHLRKKRETARDQPATLSEAISNLIDRLSGQVDTDKHVQGMSTSFVDIDYFLDGLHSSQLITFAARPGMGATTLALGIGCAVAQGNNPVIFFSTKTSKNDLIERAVATTAMVAHNKLQRAQLSANEWAQVARELQLLSQSPMLVDDNMQLGMGEIVKRCEETQKRFGKLSLVILDSVNYLHTGSDSLESTEGFARGLKSLARDFGCAVIAIAPVSRDVENRVNKRPGRGDLDGWQELANMSDALGFIYRDEYYNDDSPDRGLAELIFTKNSRGPIGTVRLIFSIDHGGFMNFSIPSSGPKFPI
ncbi:DnaB-like helicase C-terminal domain-containing protein [Achromobacter xylosoxidans]